MSDKIVERIQYIEKPAQLEKVGIYCRVSTATGAQLHSLAAQASYLTKYVMRHSGWYLTDIYLDVESGSGTTKRQEFNRMLADAKAGIITTVITKSISRFGRNVEDILTATRALTDVGATVFFEGQGIDSKSPQCELYITSYGALAQGENQSVSESIRWGIRARVKDGTSAIYDRPCFGYDVDEQGTFIINEEEAVVVRKIYNLYLDGYSVVKIKATLEQSKIPSPNGKEKWSKNTIERILTNKKYCGYSEVWRTYKTGDVSPKRVTNKGEHERAEMEGHHEAIIIPLELFEMVQAERASRSNIEIDENGCPKRKSTKYSTKKK